MVSYVYHLVSAHYEAATHSLPHIVLAAPMKGSEITVSILYLLENTFSLQERGAGGGRA